MEDTESYRSDPNSLLLAVIDMQQARVGKNAFAGIYGLIEVDECMVSALMYKLAAPAVFGIINKHPMTDYYVCNNNVRDQFGKEGEDAGGRYMYSGCMMTEECRGVNATVIMPHEPGSDTLIGEHVATRLKI